MKNRNRIILAGGLIAAASLGTASAVAASAAADRPDDDGTEVPIAGADLQRASKAALAHTGGGRVTETEMGDEDSWYEVEVTFDDGRQVDVQLDESFAVVEVMDDRQDSDDD